jgi:pimeloyl-ACP methyl ester carboxylesterase
LDYEDIAAGTTYVSFIKWASNSTTTNCIAQDILLNPGGSGSSGINMLLLKLPALLHSLGTENNLVGFDPRGVNNSGPVPSCFCDGELGTSRLYRDLDTPVDMYDTRFYGEVFARATAFGEFCTKAHSAANDMRHYIELLAKSKGQNVQNAQLWYYGLSYGSVLGTTFAALLPNCVGRIAVDGIVDGQDYYNGKWSATVADADYAFRYFFRRCHDVGKDKCAFGAYSPDMIEHRFNKIAADLQKMPIPATLGTPLVITHTHLEMVVAKAPYFPLDSYMELAKMLVELEKGNGTGVADNLGLALRFNGCSVLPLWSYPDTEPGKFIACTDANGRANLTYEGFVVRADELICTSKYLGEAWAAGTSISCRKLDIRAPKSQVFNEYPSAPKTSNPLLFLSASIDQVTPLRSARKMTNRFGGAKLLIQDSVGHTTTASASVYLWVSEEVL